MNKDRRLIEDYLPIKAISKEASREKSVRKGHISTLHLWWARRPLVACRAAVYGVLVPEDQFRPKNGPPEKRNSLGRANAAKFLERLCKYPGNPQVIKEALRLLVLARLNKFLLKNISYSVRFFIFAAHTICGIKDRQFKMKISDMPPIISGP